MEMLSGTAVFEAFAAGAEAVARAVSSPVVADRWDEPSVLEEQTVGGLAGHVARGGIWVVVDYLDAGSPSAAGGDDVDTAVPAVTHPSAAAYFADLGESLTDEQHAAIRARGAATAAEGHAALAATVAARLPATVERLGSLDADQRVSVIGGIVMRVADYLGTRIVEQVVHLDDLARSVGMEDSPGWALPAGCVTVAADVATEVVRIRRGDPALVRALYRRGFADHVLPVL